MSYQQYLDKWKGKLHLQDWDIRLITNCTPDELGESLGNVSYTLVSKQAVIRLLDPKLYTNKLFDYNPKKTILHELMHLKFSLLDNSGNDIQDTVIHMMVEEFAIILYDSEKESRKE